MPSRSRLRPLQVTVVSGNPQTIEALEDYLRGAGVTAQGTRHIEDALQLVSPTAAAAVVLFPDDFSRDIVSQVVAALRAQRANTLLVIVTSEPKRFQGPPSPGDGAALVVVPRPAWGWSILDAIRARFDDIGSTSTTTGKNLPRKRQGPA